MQRGIPKSQPHFLGYGLVGYRLIPFALITVATPARDTALRGAVHPATPRSIQRRRAGEAHTCSSLSEPPFQRVLVLFTVFTLFNCWAGLYRRGWVLSRRVCNLAGLLRNKEDLRSPDPKGLEDL